MRGRQEGHCCCSCCCCVSSDLTSTAGSIHEQMREVFIFDELLQSASDVDVECEQIQLLRTILFNPQDHDDGVRERETGKSEEARIRQERN